MSSNVIFIFKQQFLGSFQQDQKRRRRFDGPFLLGVMSTLLAPQVVFCLFFGSVFAAVFGACALSGSAFGIRSYRRLNSPVIELQLGAGAQVPVGIEPRLEKLA